MKFKINWTIVIILLLMWIGIMTFFYLKADEITNSPCEVCAKKLDSEVTCTISKGGVITQRIYYPNLTFSDKSKNKAQQDFDDRVDISEHQFKVDIEGDSDVPME